MDPMNRREFLGKAALGTVALSALARGERESKTLKVGLIGCGWYGMVDVKAALQVGGVEVSALCDVDSEHLENSAKEVEKLAGKRPKTFKMYQELLDTPGLEAVIIATPPHWHALPFIAACEKGLDIYCEKPLAYDIREGQAMVEAARKSGRIIQIGFQRRQSAAIREAAEHIRSGRAGRIVQVDVGINYTAGMRDAKPQDPPASLDWDLWCGPGPKLPYSPNIGHFAWRLEAASGNGHLVDWGIHLIDTTRVVLEESMPKSIQAAGGIYFFKDQITTPDVLTAHFEFEKCPVIWRHRIWGAQEYSPEIQNGIFFFGEKETVFASDNRWMILPRGKGKERKEMKPETPDGMPACHMANFLEAVRTRKQPVCPPEEGFRSTATVQLGMIAYHAAAKIQWDEERKEIPGNPRAAKFLKRPYRAPWKHPYQG